MDPVTGEKIFIPKRLEPALDFIAGKLREKSLGALLDGLGHVVLPKGQVHRDLLLTAGHIAREATPFAIEPEVVYFLLLKSAVVYVGRTSRLAARLENHQRDGKVFDAVYAFQPELPADLVETYYLLRLNPAYNNHRTALTPATAAGGNFVKEGRAKRMRRKRDAALRQRFENGDFQR